MNDQPPKHALKFLRWFCREDYLEEIEGDLIELFEKHYDQAPRRAKRVFFWQVLRHFRPDFIKSFKPGYMINPGMLRHNLLIAYRGFLRDKNTFLINLIGLSTGLACVFLIYLWVNSETSIDGFHEKDDRLYQVMLNLKVGQGLITSTGTPAPLLTSAFKEEMPEVEYAAPVSDFRSEGTLTTGIIEIQAEAKFAGPDFFQVFSFPLLQGDKGEVLNNLNGAILTESLAKKLFDTTEGILGKSLEWRHEHLSAPFQVAGVMADVPANSTIQFDLIFPYQIYLDHTKDWKTDQWYTAAGQTYLILRKGADIDQFNAKIANYLKPKSHWTANTSLFVQQYSKRYLHGRYEDGKVVGGRIAYVHLFSIIGLFILLIACINFMNLSTAQASRKMKEIGVKKAVGAGRSALVMQYLSESAIMAVLSFFMATSLIILLLPQFSQMIGKELQLHWDASLLTSVLGIVLLTGLLAGSYPAFYLSGFDPATIFKGKRNTAAGEKWVRKGLVVFQFALSVIFIVSVLVINEQMKYAQAKNLGYDRDHILTFQRGAHEEDPEVFLSELKKIPGVRMASNMGGSILSNWDSQAGYDWNADEAEDEAYLFKAPQIGYDVIETLGMELLTGRSFSREHNDDHTKIIINESALKMMQLDDPIGFTFDKDVGDDRREDRQIIGVVKDFQYGSIHHPVEPLILRFRNWGRDILLKVEAGAEKNAIEQIERIFKAHHPDEDFVFSFLDEDYQALYEAESRVAVLSKYFSGLAIIISCLGLFGLVAFTAERRRKELSIRKVLGASAYQLVHLLSADFTKIILAAILIGLPVSYLLAGKWLDNFAYSIGLHWWFFAGAAGATLLIAWLTVGFQTLKAARVNPVVYLKDE